MADRPSLRKEIDDLLAIMRALRTPGAGCPWDLEQSFETIAPYTIEEAYEVADAIARDDRGALKDELGDLLLQVVYHAQMADELGDFAFADVVDTIARKMVRRHPDVFSDPGPRSAFESEGVWERIKDEEKGEAAGSRSVLADVPPALPALMRAQKLQAKAARVGFDWPDISSTFAKMDEEVGELKEALEQNHERDDVAEELGDLLFAVVNVARKSGLDAEALLRRANAKFERRFSAIEQALAEDGRQLGESCLEEMDAIWDQAKAKERAAKS